METCLLDGKRDVHLSQEEKKKRKRRRAINMKKFELCETAEYCVMTDTAEEDQTFCRWPTAPDGYIPNSIIRSWRKKRKRSSGEDFWEEFFSVNLYIDKDELNEEEERTADKVFYSYFDVDKIDISEIGRKKSVGPKLLGRRKSSRGRKTGRKVSIKQKIIQKKKESGYDLGSLALQSDMQQRKSLKTSRRSLVSQRSDRRRSGRLSKAGIEEGLQLGLGEGIQHPSQEFDTVPGEGQQPSVDYGDVDISKQDDQTQISTTETPLPKAPPPTPEDQKFKRKVTFELPQEQYLPQSTDKHDKYRSKLALTKNAMSFFRKQKEAFSPQMKRAKFSSGIRRFSYGRRKSRRGSPAARESINFKRGKSSTGKRQTGLTKALDFSLAHFSTGLHRQAKYNRRRSRVSSSLSTRSRKRSKVQPESPSDLKEEGDRKLPPSLSLGPISDNRALPEWRKNLYKLIALKGFRSSRAQRRFSVEYPNEPSIASKLSAKIPILQQGQAEKSQQEKQKIELKKRTMPTRQQPTKKQFAAEHPQESPSASEPSHRRNLTKVFKLMKTTEPTKQQTTTEQFAAEQQQAFTQASQPSTTMLQMGQSEASLREGQEIELKKSTEPTDQRSHLYGESTGASPYAEATPYAGPS
ncbi:hypothetical protein CCH79_00010248, partial [Gambusia affinis]